LQDDNYRPQATERSGFNVDALLQLLAIDKNNNRLAVQSAVRITDVAFCQARLMRHCD